MSTKQDSINDKFMEKLDQLSEKMNQVSISVAQLPQTLTDKFDERYASKRTEKAVDRIGWMIISAFVLAGIALIIQVK